MKPEIKTTEEIAIMYNDEPKWNDELDYKKWVSVESVKAIRENIRNKIFEYALEEGGDKLHLNQIIDDGFYEFYKELSGE